MEKTKLIQVLRSLQDTEWGKLADFLASPYFNNDPELLQLFHILRQWLTKDLIVTKESADLARKIWPGKPYDAKQLTYLQSRLNKLVEYFLVLQKMSSDPLLVELTALETFSERNLDKHYAATKRSISRQLAAPFGDSFNFFRNKAQFTEILDQHYVRQKNRVFDPAIQQAALDLDIYYYLRRLNFASSMLDRQHILKSVYQLEISPEWIHHLQSCSAGQEPIIKLYLGIYKMLSEESEETHFSLLKQNLIRYADKIAQSDLTEIYQFAINYCARKIRQGKESYVQEALQFYVKGIESGFLIIDGQLSPWTYANVIKLYLRQKEYESARVFIEKFLTLLPESFQHNAYHYNLAELYYYTKQLEKAQSHLIEVAFSDLNYYLGARVLLAKIYYETKEEDALSSLLAAFIMFLQRNKALSQDIKQTYLNFCKIFARILRTAPANRSTLRTNITTTPLLTDREWLLYICDHSV